MSEANKAVIRRWFEEVVSQGKLELIDEIFALDFVPHRWRGFSGGREGIKARIREERQAYVPFILTIDDMICEGDKVAARVTANGVHVGDIRGLPATGKPFSLSEIHIFRLRDSQIVEHWREVDHAGLREQLGLPWR